MTRLTIRLDFDSGASLGPGKIGLLECVRDTGSIRKAAGRMDMSFRQAWLLLQAIEQMFGAPVTETARGGPGGGGTKLTELGVWVVARYRELEGAAKEAAERPLGDFARRVRPFADPGARARETRSIKRKHLK